MAEIKAKIGHAMPDTHPQAAAMNKFTELVATYTNGNVKVQPFHAAMLGSDEKMLQAVQAGTQELYIGTLAPLSTRIKEVQVWDLPFLFQNEKEVYSVLDGPSSKKIFDKLEPSGLVGLTWTGMGFRNLSNSRRSVTNADDVSGLKLRVMANPVALDTWKTIGANAVPMAFSEVFTALEVKALDGQENPLLHMWANKMQEVQKYISITNHVYTPVALVASKKFWDTLSDADKAGIQKAATEAGLLQRKLLDEGDKDVIDKFKEAGVTVDVVPPAELSKVQEKVKPVVAKFKPQIGEDFVNEFIAEIEKARTHQLTCRRAAPSGGAARSPCSARPAAARQLGAGPRPNVTLQRCAHESLACEWRSKHSSRLLEIVMVVCMVVMLVMVFGNVVLRLFFNTGIDLSEEMPRFAFVWMTFLGGIVGLHRRSASRRRHGRPRAPGARPQGLLGNQPGDHADLQLLFSTGPGCSTTSSRATPRPSARSARCGSMASAISPARPSRSSAPRTSSGWRWAGSRMTS